MQAGNLNRRLSFQQKDGKEWRTIMRRWCSDLYLRGGEAVIAGRLAGTNTVVITTWKDSETETVTGSWRIKDENTGEAFGIKTWVISKDRSQIDFTCESVQSG